MTVNMGELMIGNTNVNNVSLPVVVLNRVGKSSIDKELIVKKNNEKQ